jgi:S-adenosylmethionine hydrolase
MKFSLPALGLLVGILVSGQAVSATSPLVLYTDFGLKDGAVSAMKGVAYGVSQKLLISDLSHENPRIIGRRARYSSRSSIQALAPIACPSF